MNAPDSYGSRDRITKYPELKFEKKERKIEKNTIVTWFELKCYMKNYLEKTISAVEFYLHRFR